MNFSMNGFNVEKSVVVNVGNDKFHFSKVDDIYIGFDDLTEVVAVAQEAIKELMDKEVGVLPNNGLHMMNLLKVVKHCKHSSPGNYRKLQKSIIDSQFTSEKEIDKAYYIFNAIEDFYDSL